MFEKEDVVTGKRKESDCDVLRIGVKSKTCFMHAFFFKIFFLRNMFYAC